ncbi:hypothetical protein HZP32_14920 [Elizabethkingia anophelis]|nr:hypothetical protein [Elizabethkingia anophelis]
MNLQNKQQSIKAAYGEHWDKVKDYVNKNGWCDFKAVFGDIGNGKGLEGIELETMNNYDPKYCYWKRPKSLSGIENNRGWTRIESEEDLPKDRNIEDLLIFTETGEILVASSKYLSDAEIRRYWIKTVSHWQKFVKPNPPIF